MVDGSSARDILDGRAEPFDHGEVASNEGSVARKRQTPEPVKVLEAKRQEPVEAAAAKPVFALLPVALVAGGYAYVTGGQVMSTDNAYVQARSLGVSTDVSGTVAAIEVHDNQHVEKGQVLFRLKSDSFRIVL